MFRYSLATPQSGIREGDQEENMTSWKFCYNKITIESHIGTTPSRLSQTWFRWIGCLERVQDKSVRPPALSLIDSKSIANTPSACESLQLIAQRGTLITHRVRARSKDRAIKEEPGEGWWVSVICFVKFHITYTAHSSSEVLRSFAARTTL